MKQKTEKIKVYNLVILDKSGSMGSIRQAAIDGVNETINGIKKAQEKYSQTQEHFLTLHTFCSCEQRDVYDNVAIACVNPITESDYDPCCSTPLYDAIGFSLTKLQDDISHAGCTTTAVVTIVTDGLENASKHFTGPQIAEMIDGLRKKGWTFAYMGADHDVESVARQLRITNTRQFEHDDCGTRMSWDAERRSRSRHYDRIQAMMERGPMTEEDRVACMCSMNERFYEEPQNSIFVFGSNNLGRHNGGAARAAVIHHGAIMGQAEGLQGSSYAIPTVGVSLKELIQAVQRFCQFVQEHPEMQFKLTAVGCGNAGFVPEQIAPLFDTIKDADNVIFPPEFVSVYNNKRK